jgi:DNA-binding transcriptional regulator GbsR (MarR family)
MKKIISKKETSANLLAELSELEKQVGNFMQHWGFKKIHGRIWVHLYTSNQALDSISLMKRLNVSKGLMSLALRELLEFDVIKTQSVGKHGSVFYEANLDLTQVITHVLRQREAAMMKSTLGCLAKLMKFKKNDIQKLGLNYERIENINQLTMTAHSTLQMLISQSAAF